MLRLQKVKNMIYTASILMLVSPFIVYAQTKDFKEIIVGTTLPLLRLVVTFIISLTVLVILWNGTQMIIQADNAEKKADSKAMMLWGIVVLFIMVSIWGIIGIFQTTFGI